MQCWRAQQAVSSSVVNDDSYGVHSRPYHSCVIACVMQVREEHAMGHDSGVWSIKTGVYQKVLVKVARIVAAWFRVTRIKFNNNGNLSKYSKTGYPHQIIATCIYIGQSIYEMYSYTNSK